MPASSGMTRQARGGAGVTRRLTPSGEIRTRRSAIRAVSAAARGMPMTTDSTSSRLSDRSPVKNGAPVNGMRASGARSSQKMPKPATTPAVVATLDSMLAMAEICRGVAPTRRIAAKRCSRRAAESRVAPPMKISTGKNRAAMTTERIRMIPLLSMPTPSAQAGPLQSLGGVALIRETSMASLWPARSVTLRPTMMTSESGAGSAASPIVPTCVPGKRSPSSLAGVFCRSLLRAGEA